MINFMDPLARLRTVFAGGVTPDPSMGTPPIVAPSPMDEVPRGTDPMSFDPSEIVNPRDQVEAAQPKATSHTMQDRLLDLLNNAPVRQRPGMFRKIAGALEAIHSSDPDRVERALYEPYYRQMQDYNQNFERTFKGAQLERQMSALDWQNYFREQANTTKNREITRKEDQTNTRLDQGQQKIDNAKELADKRAEIQEEALKGITQIYSDETGKDYAVRKNGTIDLLPQNLFTNYDRQKMIESGHMQQIQARGNIQKAIVDAQQAGATARNNASIAGANARNAASNASAERRATLRGPSARAAASGMKEGEKKQLKINLANEFLRNNSWAKDYLSIDDKGNVVIKEPRNMSPEEQDSIDLIRHYVDPDYTGPGVSTSSDIQLGGQETPKPETTTPAPATTTPPPPAATPAPRSGSQFNRTPPATTPVVPPEGKIKVLSPDGKTKGFIPLKQWPEAEKAGYKKVIE